MKLTFTLEEYDWLQVMAALRAIALLREKNFFLRDAQLFNKIADDLEEQFPDDVEN